MTYGEFAKIYDELICEDIDYNKIYKRINELIKIYNCNNEDYLDLACGTGNVATKFVNQFKNAFLVDLSQEMLQIAFDKLKKERVKAKIICQDMTELQLNHSFDLITCVLDSTNYLTEDGQLKSYFSAVNKHLKEDGLFIFDINSYYKLTNILGNNVFTYDDNDVFYTWENILDNDVVNMYLTFFVKNGDLYERFDEEHYERAYTEQQIEDTLSECGLSILGKFDGYSNKKVSKDSERILYAVKKKKEI